MRELRLFLFFEKWVFKGRLLVGREVELLVGLKFMVISVREYMYE